MSVYKRVLLLGHNSLSDTKANGKVLTSLFSKWPREKIAQLYFWNEWPSMTICDNFFRLRDYLRLCVFFRKNHKAHFS